MFRELVRLALSTKQTQINDALHTFYMQIFLQGVSGQIKEFLLFCFLDEVQIAEDADHLLAPLGSTVDAEQFGAVLHPRGGNAVSDSESGSLDSCNSKKRG